jgi:D-glycero-D-manno-heptose 1,7-bisphosphate phosphatase
MADAQIFTQYRLFIFDADDTLRRTTVPGRPCPHRPGEWELMPGVRETLAPVPWERDGGPHLGLASNQDQVGYGYLSMKMARDLLRDLARAAAGVEPVDAALELCPHALHVDCDCRKPKPGMLFRIMAHFDVAPGATVFVGNDAVDQEAAARAGVAYLPREWLFAQEARTAQQ